MSEFEIRPARRRDALPLAELTATVAEERDGIAVEPPIDVTARAKQFGSYIDGTLVAVSGKDVIGSLYLNLHDFGTAELGMLVAKDWRGRGVGTALLEAAIERARSAGMHKISLEVFPHNKAALALYRKFGFVVEGRRIRHYRRQSGEFWDSLIMGLLLERTTTPTAEA